MILSSASTGTASLLSFIFVSFLILSQQKKHPILQEQTCPLSPMWLDEGQPCNTSMGNQCKNFLVCKLNNTNDLNHTCTSVQYGSSCNNMTENDCGDEYSFLSCITINETTGASICLSQYLENGDICNVSAQCLSQNCVGGFCVGSQNLTGPCDINNPWVCNYPFVCLKNDSSSTAVCSNRLPVGANCTQAYIDWESLLSHPAYPNPICVSGAVCFRPVNSSMATCVQLYEGLNQSSCSQSGLGLECGYNLTCFDTYGNNSLFCTPFVQTQPNNCTDPQSESNTMDNSVLPQCLFGQWCLCMNETATPTCQTVMGTDYCAVYLQDLVSCVQSSGCSYRPALFPYGYSYSLSSNGTSHDYRHDYADQAYPGLCIHKFCATQHARFVCCQNNNSLINEEDPSWFFTPARTPDGSYCNFPTGWPNWVVPVIVLCSIIAAVIIVVVVYVLCRKRPEDEGYTPINK